MTKEEKKQALISLTEQVKNASNFYVTDASALNVASINQFRALCYQEGIKFQVVKNTLLRKAFEANEGNYDELYPVLHGSTSLMFSDVANAPAKLLKKFRLENEKPILKAAYIESEVYIGDDMIKELVAIKSREELIGGIITMLQSPITNVVSALNSGGNTLSGLVKTLSEREN